MCYYLQERYPWQPCEWQPTSGIVTLNDNSVEMNLNLPWGGGGGRKEQNSTKALQLLTHVQVNAQ